MLRVFLCECGQKMKVPIESLGKTGTCVSCGRPITVTLENTAPDDPKRRPKPPLGAASQPLAEERPGVRDEALYESEGMSVEGADAAAFTPVETAEAHAGHGKGIAPEGGRRAPPPKPRTVGPPPLPPRVRMQSDLNPRVPLEEIPKRIGEVLWENEIPLYASRPAHSKLVLSMIVWGIFWSVVGLCLLVVGIIVTLPLALVIIYYKWKNSYYIITPERTIVSQGIFNVGITVLFNRHIQLISINTGILERWLGLSTVEVSTAAQGGAGGIMALFPGLARGGARLTAVNVKDVIGCYDVLRKGT